MPHINQASSVQLDRPIRLTHATQGKGSTDPVLQSSTGPKVSTTTGLNFPGVGQGNYGFTPNAAPPDANGAVGATQPEPLGRLQRHDSRSSGWLHLLVYERVSEEQWHLQLEH